jgi:hypothetical protein
VRISLPDLVALLYRADWTRLSLSATLAWSRDPAVEWELTQRKLAELRPLFGPLPRIGLLPDWEPDDAYGGPEQGEQQILLAPGGRYRIEAGDGDLVSVGDGRQGWPVEAADCGQQPAVGPGGPFFGLVAPQWLLACYELTITGEQLAGGRPAIRVLAARRPVPQRRRGGVFHLVDRVEVLVDAELGILLGSELTFAGRAWKTARLRDLITDPAQAAEPGRFALPDPPPGAGDEARAAARTGLGWQVAGAAGAAAGSAMGFAIRHAPRRQAVWPSEDEPDMPRDARLSAAEWAVRQPPGDALVKLLYGPVRPALGFAAELHQWVDGEVMHERANMVRLTLPSPLEGILGPDALWEAVGERIGDYGGHRVARLQVRVPDWYRLDYLSGDWDKRYTSMACDGEHTSKLFTDRVATGPATPLDPDLAALLDPAWLLSGWRLLSSGPVTVRGRAGIRLLAEITGAGEDNTGNSFTATEVVVDAELGILLRQTAYVGEHPAVRTELRELMVRDGDTAEDFRIEPARGLRAVADSGGPLGDRNLPRVVETAGTAAGLAVAGAVAGAVALTGWLGKHRPRRDQP